MYHAPLLSSVSSLLYSTYIHSVIAYCNPLSKNNPCCQNSHFSYPFTAPATKLSCT